MLGLVRQICGAVLHPDDPAARISGGNPLLIGNPLLGTIAVELAKVFVRGILDSRFDGQLAKICFSVLAAVFANDGLHGRLGLDEGRSYCTMPVKDPFNGLLQVRRARHFRVARCAVVASVYWAKQDLNL